MLFSVLLIAVSIYLATGAHLNGPGTRGTTSATPDLATEGEPAVPVQTDPLRDLAARAAAQAQLPPQRATYSFQAYLDPGYNYETEDDLSNFKFEQNTYEYAEYQLIRTWKDAPRNQLRALKKMIDTESDCLILDSGTFNMLMDLGAPDDLVMKAIIMKEVSPKNFASPEYGPFEVTPLTRALEFKRYTLARELLKFRFTPYSQVSLLEEAAKDAVVNPEAKAFLELYNLNLNLYKAHAEEWSKDKTLSIGKVEKSKFGKFVDPTRTK